MRADQLSAQTVQRVEPGGINTEPAQLQIVVWGIHGGSDHVTGIRFGDSHLGRAQGEDAEALRLRAMREVVPALPADALRDRNGKPVGYFTYAGLPPEHCRATAEQEARL